MNFDWLNPTKKRGKANVQEEDWDVAYSKAMSDLLTNIQKVEEKIEANKAAAAATASAAADMPTGPQFSDPEWDSIDDGTFEPLENVDEYFDPKNYA